MHISDPLLKYFPSNIWAALREKVPNVLSRCHTKKKDGRAGPRPPFFWYDTDFSKKYEKKIEKIEKKKSKKKMYSKKTKKSVSYRKKGGCGPARLSFFWYDNDSEH